MSTYKVGIQSQQIKLSVDINTFGLAASRAIVLDMASTAPGITVAKSQNATGDIPRKNIGTAVMLANKRLSILSKIDLVGSDEDNELEAGRVGAKYILDDGEEGHIEFDDPVKKIAADFSTVILFKVIDLNP